MISSTQNPFSSPVQYLYVHGLGGRGGHGVYWSSCASNDINHYILNEPFDFPDAIGKFNPLKTDLAQEIDVSYLAAQYQGLSDIASRANNSPKKFVLAGVSRGAATLINFASDKRYNLKDVAMLILESPFDIALNVMKFQAERLFQSWNPLINNLGSKWSMTKLYPKHDPNGISPIKSIGLVPKHIPVVLIHSRKDAVISVNASRKLYIELKKSGHNHAYYFETEDGVHAKVLWGSQGKTYQYLIHALYKKYGLPHNNDFAVKGLELLTLCQPTVEYITSLIK